MTIFTNSYIACAVVVLFGAAIFFHELGHFWLGRWVGGLSGRSEETALTVGGRWVAGRTPAAICGADRCRACSLIELCRPKAGAKSALSFRARAIDAALDDGETSG